MFHQQIKLPEKHDNYPTLWNSLCGKWRIIKCKDGIQFIVQQFKRPTWRSESYHVDWSSIALIHGDNPAFNTLPDSIQPCPQ